jgi:hypothetical protein
LGLWKNFEELEESISMPELLSILEASRKDKNEEKEFQAALQGIKLKDDGKGGDTPSFEDVKRRVMGLDGDISSISGSLAEQEGFGIGQGLGYREE